MHHGALEVRVSPARSVYVLGYQPHFSHRVLQHYSLVPVSYVVITAPDQMHLWFLQGSDCCILVLLVFYPASTTLMCSRCSKKIRILDIILAGGSRASLVFKMSNSKMFMPFRQENNFLSHDFLDSPSQRMGLRLEWSRSSRLSIICSPFSTYGL